MNYTAEQQRVEQFYEKTAVQEWDRMSRNPIEFALTKRAIEEHGIQEHATVLDVGGGPGRYAIWLAELGHSVTLFDLSSANLALAKQKAAEAQVDLHEVIQGSATQLNQSDDQRYDVVLMLGPIYHLRNIEERRTALREARRVLKPGGTIFVAFLNRYALLRYVAKDECGLLAEEPGFIDSLLANGCPRSSKFNAAFSDTSYWSHPSEIDPLMAECGFDKVDLVNVEGALAYIDDAVKELPAAEFERWMALNYQLAKVPELYASGIHLVYVGR